MVAFAPSILTYNISLWTTLNGYLFFGLQHLLRDSSDICANENYII